MWADQALARFVKCADVYTVLDVGAGDNQHAQIMREAGLNVTTISLRPPADWICDYMTTRTGRVDGIWASHVLEHMPNVGDFLKKCFADLHHGGVLAVTVPPAKHNLVGGHVSLWNEGLLLYRLILAGFDCREARVGVYGYNLSVIVRKVAANLPPLAMDNGDIERLTKFFPFPIKQGTDGRCGNINWKEST